MRKFVIAMCLFLPVAVVANSQAQRKNNTKADVETQQMMNCPCKAEKGDCKCKNMEQHHKMMKDKWIKKQNAEVDEYYQEALEKVKKSSYPQAYKEMLNKQAQENKTLALKHAKETNEQLQKNWEARKNFWANNTQYKKEDMMSKHNRKACKEVDEIIK